MAWLYYFLPFQIKYLTQVSTGHPHEGSSYPAQKVLQCATHRLEHTKSRLNELDRLRQGGLTPAQKQQLLAAQQASKQQQQQQQQLSQQLLVFCFSYSWLNISQKDLSDDYLGS